MNILYLLDFLSIIFLIKIYIILENILNKNKNIIYNNHIRKKLFIFIYLID